MRAFIASLALLALGGCGISAPSAPSGCAREASHQLEWSTSDAPDVIFARAEGPTCAQGIVTLTIRDAQGNPLWAFADSHYALTAGDGWPAEGLADVSAEQMDAFLAGWADLTSMRSNELPEWRADAATLSESATTFSYDTPFTRDVYEALRARSLPMLCYAGGAETSTCLIIDPASGAPARMVSFGP